MVSQQRCLVLSLLLLFAATAVSAQPSECVRQATAGEKVGKDEYAIITYKASNTNPSTPLLATVHVGPEQVIAATITISGTAAYGFYSGVVLKPGCVKQPTQVLVTNTNPIPVSNPGNSPEPSKSQCIPFSATHAIWQGHGFTLSGPKQIFTFQVQQPPWVVCQIKKPSNVVPFQFSGSVYTLSSGEALECGFTGPSGSDSISISGCAVQ
ncbi:MAG: hypothetical protein ACJ8AT_21760 [Hyalangium sp.]|uniref:hypothetical protein n=1 Tax=Hyalangium sp. TaxID=2028555 RepID=UPI00389B0CA1